MEWIASIGVVLIVAVAVANVYSASTKLFTNKPQGEGQIRGQKEQNLTIAG